MREDKQNESWAQLYEDLCVLLIKETKISHTKTYSDSFLLIDDNWGGHHQKICILNDGFMVDSFIFEVQLILQSKYKNWGVVVVFDAQIDRTPFVIYFDGVSEVLRWN